MSGKNFMSYGDADTILTEFSNDIKSRVSTKANQGLTAQQIANAKANIDIEKVPNVATNDQTPTFLEESTRTNIASGDKLSLIFGKIKKFFSDLKAVAFSGSYNDLSDKPSIPAAVAVKGNAETTYRTGNVNLTPANIGACAGDAPSRSGTSLAIQMDSILASGKVGVFPMYCSSGNVDYPTIGYCMALGITSKASDVSAIVAFNTQTNDIWLNCNTANTPGGWTGWKKISKDSGTTLGSSVSLKNYSSSSNKYTVPNDGYIIVYAGSGTGFSLNADSVSLGSEIMKISSSDSYTRQAVFVKKGMKVYGSPSGGSSYDFYYQPLQ